MIASQTPTFGDLLRRLRVAAELSQEALAERAGMSARGISDLERGVNRRPQRTTVERLATALALSAADRAAFDAAARGGPSGATQAQPDTLMERPHTPLPLPPTALVGRADDVASAMGLFVSEGARLVTLTGPGGVGKTRLAIQVAADLSSHEVDAAVFVSLAGVRDPALLLSSIAQAMGLREQGPLTEQEVVAAALRGRNVLLVLDNFEHLLAAAPQVADLLATCAAARILVTSRAALRLRGEREFPVLPLPAEPPAGDVTPELEALSPAALLFVQRARDVKPNFRIDAANAADVTAICARLDGLPLAIELAAARMRLLQPSALLERLGKRLPLLTGGARDLPARQKTMRDAIGWSYDLLHAGEQALFRRLAVFVGGCTLDAVETVCLTGGLAEGDALDWLSSLVEKSLLQLVEIAGSRSGAPEPRYMMLETIREYGLERLDACGEAAPTRERHLVHYLALAERARPELLGPAPGPWLEQLEREHDNMRAALEWSIATGDVTKGLRLAIALCRFWEAHGHLGEGLGWYETLLARAETHDDPSRIGAGPGTDAVAPPAGDGAAPIDHDAADAASVRASALGCAGVLAWAQGDYEHARDIHERGLALWRRLGDKRGIANALNNLGLVAQALADYHGASALYEESLAYARDVGDRQLVGMAIGNLGNARRDVGDYAHAAMLVEETLAIARDCGAAATVALALNNRALVAYCQGELDRAGELAAQSLEMRRQAGDKQGTADSLYLLGGVARRQGDRAAAARMFVDSITLCQEVGDRWGIAACLEGLAMLSCASRQAERGAALFGAADALRRLLRSPMLPHERADYEAALAASRQMLGDAAFDAAWSAGQALPLEEAVAQATGVLR